MSDLFTAFTRNMRLNMLWKVQYSNKNLFLKLAKLAEDTSDVALECTKCTKKSAARAELLFCLLRGCLHGERKILKGGKTFRWCRKGIKDAGDNSGDI